MLSKRVSHLKPSATLALSTRAKELKSAGKDVISLAVGEPDWNTFQVASSAGIQAIEEGFTKYVPASGTLELRKAIAQKTSQETGIPYEFKNVSVTGGAKFSIFTALQCLVDSGDEVIFPSPYWVSYPTMVDLSEGTAVKVPTLESEKFKLQNSSLRKHLSDKTKVLLLNSPSNPTGEYYEESELKDVADILLKYPRVVVLTDDIYNCLTFNGKIAPHILNVAPELSERTVCVNGASKTYSMTGWRVGWAVGPESIIKSMTNYQSQTLGCASAISQRAALAAIQSGQPELQTSLKTLKKRRDFAVNKLNTIEGLNVTLPNGAFYIWLNISQLLGKSFEGQTLKTSGDFCEALLMSQMVVTVPGIEFGMEGYLRLSYALSQDRMSEAIDKIHTFIKSLVDG